MGKLEEAFAALLTSLTSDGHIPCGMIIFLIGAAIYTWRPGGLDATFVTFTTSILGFLGSHLYIQNKYSNGNNHNNGNGNGNGSSTPTPSPVAPS
jgi:hypothetical protein